jgi:hypothetical protein
MAHYRLYFFDAKGHITRGLELECRDDDEAIKRASEHDIGSAMELWRGAHRVKRFEATG